jgi:hypothetical protein
MKCTNEKNISLAMMGYKIFFSSTALTLKCKPITGLTINCKPVAGLKTKNCQLFSGRDTFIQNLHKINKKYYQGDGINDPLIQKTDTDNTRVLGYFLDFINEADIGITLFETNASFNSFIKLDKQPNGPIVKTPCN